MIWNLLFHLLSQLLYGLIALFNSLQTADALTPWFSHLILVKLILLIAKTIFSIKLLLICLPQKQWRLSESSLLALATVHFSVKQELSLRHHFTVQIRLFQILHMVVLVHFISGVWGFPWFPWNLSHLLFVGFLNAVTLLQVLLLFVVDLRWI